MSSKYDDSFVVITCQPEAGSRQEHASIVQSGDPMYGPWGEHGSAHFVDPSSFGARKLRELYPKHSIIQFASVNVLGYPGAYAEPVSAPDVISTLFFYPLARRVGQGAGVLVNDVRFGSFRVAWDKYDFILYVVKYLYGNFETSQQYLLHEGDDEQPARNLLAKAGTWNNELHQEVYIFDSGYWQKDHNLWLEIQKANWDDVILKDEFKTGLKKDVFGFFDSEDLYKELGIPWKRGIIMHGPPGNGKTISMKAIMKGADAKGYYPLYVKSFRSWKGEEGAMADVFEKARQLSPCVLILEDLDSLVNNNNRSFFLNQLDGLDSNDGLLVIGTTNHLDRIDPALSERPSRFDRKYLFDDPDTIERKLYAQYWQDKLRSNRSIDFPDSLVDEVAKTTEKFSFAYLKEVFVSTLVLLAGYEDKAKPSFAHVLRGQIKLLRKQLDSTKPPTQDTSRDYPHTWRAAAAFPQNFADRSRVDYRLANQPRIWDASIVPQPSSQMPGELHVPGASDARDGRDLRSMANAAAALGRSFIF